MIEQTAFFPLFRGLKDLQRHYRALFGSRNPSTEAVIADLAKFCCFLSTTASETPADSDRAEGRRQVFLRIIEHSKLTTEELFTILSGLDEAQRVALFDSRRAPVPPYEVRDAI